MIGSKWVKALAVIVVFIAMGILLVGQQRENIRLHRENVALARQVKQLEQRESENNSLSNQIAQAEIAEANQQLLELVRLRNEVGMFRRQTNELRQMQEQLEWLRAGATGDAAASQNTNASAEPLAVYPKDKWEFVGYDTPENAFQSLNWAALNGDMTMLKSNLTLDAQREFARAFEKNSETETREQLMRSFNEKSEVRILTKDVISDNFVVLGVSDGKPEGDVDKLIFQKIDGQWKFVSGH
jgi:hypothetical protein